MNMVRCLLAEKEMPRSLWPDAARWTAHVLNRSLTKAIKDKVPEERWTGVKPKVDYFRVFGSVAHVHIPEQKQIKLDDRSHKCILLSVSDESKAYRLYDPITKKITISRDVIFEENAKWDWDLNVSDQNDLTWGDDGVSEGEETDTEENENGETENENGEAEGGAATEENDETPRTEIPEPERGGSSRRVTKQPFWMQDFVSGEEIGEENWIYLALYISNDDPVNFYDARKEEKWRESRKWRFSLSKKIRHGSL